MNLVKSNLWQSLPFQMLGSLMGNTTSGEHFVCFWHSFFDPRCVSSELSSSLRENDPRLPTDEWYQAYWDNNLEPVREHMLQDDFVYEFLAKALGPWPCKNNRCDMLSLLLTSERFRDGFQEVLDNCLRNVCRDRLIEVREFLETLWYREPHSSGSL